MFCILSLSSTLSISWDTSQTSAAGSCRRLSSWSSSLQAECSCVSEHRSCSRGSQFDCRVRLVQIFWSSWDESPSNSWCSDTESTTFAPLARLGWCWNSWILLNRKLEATRPRLLIYRANSFWNIGYSSMCCILQGCRQHFHGEINIFLDPFIDDNSGARDQFTYLRGGIPRRICDTTWARSSNRTGGGTDWRSRRRTWRESCPTSSWRRPSIVWTELLALCRSLSAPARVGQRSTSPAWYHRTTCRSRVQHRVPHQRTATTF